MLLLPNGCNCSNLAVHPLNWLTQKASCKIIWYIHYRFRDPEFKGRFPKGKLVAIRGMNCFTLLEDRRAATKSLLDNELDLLLYQGYNPITKQAIAPVQIDYEIDPSTPFVIALEQARKRLPLAQNTLKDMKSVIKGVKLSASQLRLDLQIFQVKRRHLKMILQQCSVNNPRWSARRYNMYRSYLLMMFKELLELEAVESNPVRDISKMKEFRKIRPVLSDAQRIQVDNHLKKFPRFRWFVHLFFHSGGRLRELVQLKAKDVNLVTQKFKVVVRKGKVNTEVEKTIKDIAVPFWQEFLTGCQPDQYLFGIDFLPSFKAMSEDTITRYWRRFVKEELGIEIDLYSLKHLNTSEVVTILNYEDAAKLNSHIGTAMVINLYDVKQKERQHNRLKGLGNSFV